MLNYSKLKSLSIQHKLWLDPFHIFKNCFKERFINTLWDFSVGLLDFSLVIILVLFPEKSWRNIPLSHSWFKCEFYWEIMEFLYFTWEFCIALQLCKTIRFTEAKRQRIHFKIDRMIGTTYTWKTYYKIGGNDTHMEWATV